MRRMTWRVCNVCQALAHGRPGDMHLRPGVPGGRVRDTPVQLPRGADHDLRRRVRALHVRDGVHGRAAQVDPMNPTLKAPGTKRLKLNMIKCFQFC